MARLTARFSNVRHALLTVLLFCCALPSAPAAAQAVPRAVPTLIGPANGYVETWNSWPDLVWDSTGTMHDVQIGPNANFSSASLIPVNGHTFQGDSYQVVGTFYWRVRVQGGAWSQVRSFSYLPRTTLTSPAIGHVTYNGAWPQLIWSSGGAANYELQVARDTGFTDIQLSATLHSSSFSAESLADPSVVVTGTNNVAGTFYWRARTADSTWPKHRSFTTYDGAAPPTNLTPANATMTSDGLWPTLMWYSSGNNSYQVQVARTSAFTSTVVDTVVSTFSYRPADNDWMKARIGTFHWRVRIVGGNWSVTRTFISSPIPIGLLPANGTTTSNGIWPTLSWDSTGSTRYEIAVSRSTSFSSCVICQTVNSTSFRPVSSSFMKAQLGTLSWRVRIPGGRWSVTRNFVNRIITSRGPEPGMR